MGTIIQSYKLGEADYRGERFQNHPVDLAGNNNLLRLTQPHIIQAIHVSYLDAGADIVTTRLMGSHLKPEFIKEIQSDYEKILERHHKERQILPDVIRCLAN